MGSYHYSYNQKEYSSHGSLGSKTDLIFLPTHLARSKSMPSGRKLRKYNKTDYYCFLVKSKSLTCFLAVGARPRV